MAAAIIVLQHTSARCADRVMMPIPAGNEAEVQIINGRPARRADWPSTLVFPGSNGRCTSTIVGKRVVLTAAHCVSDGNPTKLFWDGNYIELSCHMHSKYRGASCDIAFSPDKMVGCTADVAVCIARDEIATQPGRFERVSRSLQPVKARDVVQLLGFGCTEKDGKVVDAPQIGDATVQWPAHPGASADPDKTMEEFIKTAGAAVCGGDSGGASYSKLASPEILAIASRGNLTADSYLVDLRSPEIHQFLQSARSLPDFSIPPGDIRICGIDADAENCR